MILRGAQFGAQFSDRLCSCAAAVVRRAHAAAAARRRARRLPALRRAARRRRSRTARAAARAPRERRCRQGGLRGSGAVCRRLRALYAMGDLVAHVSAEDQRAERLTFGAEARRWQPPRTPLKVMRSLARRASTRRSGSSGRRVTSASSATARRRPTTRRSRGSHALLARDAGASRSSASACRPPARHALERERRVAVRRARDAGPAALRDGRGREGRRRGGGGHRLAGSSSRRRCAARCSEALMVAPIRATTGINTKLLVALELGIPVVATSAAAALLRRRARTNATTRNAMAIADDANSSAQAALRLTSDDKRWKAAVAAERSAFKTMLKTDPALGDMRHVIGRRARRHRPAVRPPTTRPVRWIRPASSTATSSATSSLRSTSGRRWHLRLAGTPPPRRRRRRPPCALDGAATRRILFRLRASGASAPAAPSVLPWRHERGWRSRKASLAAGSRAAASAGRGCASSPTARATRAGCVRAAFTAPSTPSNRRAGSVRRGRRPPAPRRRRRPPRRRRRAAARARATLVRRVWRLCSHCHLRATSSRTLS